MGNDRLKFKEEVTGSGSEEQESVFHFYLSF